MSDPLWRPAGELAALVRSGELSARELVEASLARIEATRALNHWTLVDADGALAAADAIGPGDGRPFAGVPIGIKDSAPVAGLRATSGSALLGEHVADHDSATVRRLRAAGFVIVGKTQMPEFGIAPVTEPRRFGPARNPWDPERSTGGSSGGSAGAVACGAVPVAHGSDGGGSLRVPAACCGLLGLKPARGRVSLAPSRGDHMLHCEGALARTTADVAALLDAIAGPEPGDASWAPPPPAPFAVLARRDPGRLRVGLSLAPPVPAAALDPECERGARAAAALLERLGHRVEEVASPLPQGASLTAAFDTLWAVNVAAGIESARAVAGRPPTPETVEPLSLWLWRRGRAIAAPDYLAAVATAQSLARAAVARWAEIDLLVTPALARRPPRHGEIDACGPDPEREFAKGYELNPYAPLWNLTGQPAVSVPLGHGADGLPTAAQIVGPPAGEGLLLAVCRQLEQAAPWADRHPAAAADGSSG